MFSDLYRSSYQIEYAIHCRKETMCFYDGDQFPGYVPIVSYLEYSLSEELPEVAYIHNPYDRSNLVTSVHPAFYSDELKKYVKNYIIIQIEL